jgi:mRNA-degrading endonuclease RelE of RelBE toxin-antitoxin system
MSYKVSTIDHFDREFKKLAKKYPSIKGDLLNLVETLVTNPFQGDGLGKDCFKVRMSISSKGKGKSGGARIITCIKVVDENIILLSIYDKSEQSDIDSKLLSKLLQINGLI